MTIHDINRIYQARIDAVSDMNADTALILAEQLFNETKIEHATDDVLLFQYSLDDTYDDATGTYTPNTHFTFDITRQIAFAGDEEPYQLHMTLVYDPQPFAAIKPTELPPPADDVEVQLKQDLDAILEEFVEDFNGMEMTHDADDIIEIFKDIELHEPPRVYYDTWSSNFDTLADFFAAVRETEGYKIAKTRHTKACYYRFEQC